MNQIKIFPSLISSNLINIEKTLVELDPVCDGFHIDVMDNHFVPNLTWGPDFVNQIAQYTNKPLSVHLMVEKPEAVITQLRLKAESIVAFHIENADCEKLIAMIKAKKLKASIALKPKTPLEKIFQYIKDSDQVLLMSVEPGFSGQEFLPAAMQRLKELSAYKQKNSLTFEIAMDGGINQKNIHSLYQQGATVFCVASAIFKTNNAIQAVKSLYDAALE